jgi:hypothetical protein
MEQREAQASLLLAPLIQVAVAAAEIHLVVMAPERLVVPVLLF